MEWLEKDPAVNYQLHFNKVERNYLTEEELNTLETSTLEKQTHKIASSLTEYIDERGSAPGIKVFFNSGVASNLAIAFDAHVTDCGSLLCYPSHAWVSQ